ncbi:hypothetical protein Dimus_034664 [Dionaea muscipula]
MEGNANTVHSNDNGKEKKPTDINHSGFENHAETAWLQMRKQWAGDCSQKPEGVPKDPVLSWTTTYEDLLLSTEPFHQPIPLAEMVDFLVDSWHEDEPDD